jgi:hypothetical protein
MTQILNYEKNAVAALRERGIEVSGPSDGNHNSWTQMGTNEENAPVMVLKHTYYWERPNGSVVGATLFSPMHEGERKFIQPDEIQPVIHQHEAGSWKWTTSWPVWTYGGKGIVVGVDS